MSKPITTHELAERLGCCVRTIQRKARNREIPHNRIGRMIRFTTAQVEEIERMIERAAVQYRPEVNVPNPVYRPHARVVPIRRHGDAA